LEFTTDIIVGYPTETEEDFNKSLEMVEKARFIKVHVFKYSKRPGTAADKLKPLNGKTLNERSEKLINYASEISKSRLSGYLGKTLRILIEEGEDGFITGHTANYIKVQAPTDNNVTDDYINTFCDVLISGLTNDGLLGTVVDKKTVR
ncbi:MAG: tRNA (N(6)-L-threonylcarbamoyladenosine(37)-C(2))-methylthiotransferase MtaB, partial [Clostridia bacterium]